VFRFARTPSVCLPPGSSAVLPVLGHARGCNFPPTLLPLQVLLSPTKKDFEHICQFLLRQLDTHWRLVGKPEDEVPLFFNWLRYPFQISKSALFAVGAPHTWPPLLAALSWLVELLTYSERAEVARVETYDERQRGESGFFEYVSRAYRCFMSGDDDACEAADQEKVAEFEARTADVKEDIQRLQEVRRPSCAPPPPGVSWSPL
jgi:kinetochore protein NDC80